jgi:hypothetical protein
MATHGEIRWPPVGTFSGRLWGDSHGRRHGLVEANNGVFGGCWCMGFHPDDSREPALNRERKLARVRAGRAHAALVFDGDDCVGWCQFGALDEVPKIKNRAAYEKGLTTL